MELCDEVVRLRAIADERHNEYSDFTQISFGTHKGKKLGDVPDDYLRWWITQNTDRQSISLDAEYGPPAKRQIARQNLKLHDYITRRFTKTDDSEIQDSRESDEAEA